MALRIIHASDLHLERPPRGLDKVPEHLRETLVDAPYRAAEQVFETALAENVDAVLLAGDVVDVARAGPPAIAFLIDAFSRLADRGTPVYWAGGSVDPPEAWPPSAKLPENVHVFPVGRVEDFQLNRDGQTIARIQGISHRVDEPIRTDGFHRDAHDVFTIGVAYGTSDSPGHEGDRVHYMALGGQHQRRTADTEPGIAHYCGTPQGRSPRETGPHGCTLVHVDDSGRTKTSFVAVDPIRYVEEVLQITASTRSEQLEERMEERLEKLLAKHAGVELLVSWQIRGAGPLVHRLRPGGLSDEILDHLRLRFGQRSPGAWSVSIESHSPLSVPAEWYDQETVLGDLLREFRQYDEDPELPLDLEQFLPPDVRGSALAKIAAVNGSDQRANLLARAAKLGVDLIHVPVEEALAAREE